jgi:hypothetical protein
VFYAICGILASGLMVLYRRPLPESSPLRQSGVSLPSRPTSSRGGQTAGIVGLYGSFGVLFLVAALRYGPGTDYWARYVPIFRRVRAGWDVDTEYGYLLINRAVASATSDYQWLFAVMSLLTIGLFYRFIVRMSMNPALSVYVFVFGGTYLEAFNLVRQGLAIAILVNTIELIVRKKALPFVLLTLLAATFHSSALLWLAVWPIVRIRGGNLARLALISGLVLVVLAAPQTLALLITRFSPGYSWYFQSNYGEVRAFDPSGLAIAILIFVASLFVLRGEESRSGYTIAVMNLQAVQIAALVATISVAYAFSRLSYYFTPIQVLAVPLVLSTIPDRTIRRSLTMIVMIIYAATFYFKFVVWNAHGVMPYESIFSR